MSNMRSRFSLKKQEAVRKHRAENPDNAIGTYAQIVGNFKEKKDEPKEDVKETKKLSVDPQKIQYIFDQLDKEDDEITKDDVTNKIYPENLERNIIDSYLNSDFNYTPVSLDEQLGEDLAKTKLGNEDVNSPFKRFSFCPILFTNDGNLKEIKEDFQVGLDNIIDSYVDIEQNNNEDSKIKENQFNPILTAPSVASQDYAEEETDTNKIETPQSNGEDNKIINKKTIEKLINEHPIKIPSDDKIEDVVNKFDNEMEKVFGVDDVANSKKSDKEEIKLPTEIVVGDGNVDVDNKMEEENHEVVGKMEEGNEEHEEEREFEEHETTLLKEGILLRNKKQFNEAFKDEYEREKYYLKEIRAEDTITDYMIDDKELEKLDITRIKTNRIDISSILSPKKSDGHIHNTQELCEDELDKKHLEKLSEEQKKMEEQTKECDEDFTKFLVTYKGKPSINQGNKGNEEIKEIKEDFQVGLDNIIDSYVDIEQICGDEDEIVSQQSFYEEENEVSQIVQDEGSKEEAMEEIKEEKSNINDLHLLGNGTPLFVKINLNVDLEDNIEAYHQKAVLMKIAANQMKKVVVEKLKKESIKLLENSGVAEDEIEKKVNLRMKIADSEWEDAVSKLDQKTSLFPSVKKN